MAQHTNSENLRETSEESRNDGAYRQRLLAAYDAGIIETSDLIRHIKEEPTGGEEAADNRKPSSPRTRRTKAAQTTGRAPYGDLSQSTGVEQLLVRGVGVPALVETLIDAAAAEFTTYYYYTILRVYLAGHEDYKDIAEDARLEDRAHFELITPRIYELGGELPHDLIDFHNRSGCPAALLPDPPTAENILEVMLEAERCAIRSWSEVCDVTFGKDPRTYDMASRILQEEIEHEAWFIELLAYERGEGPRPSGHFRRGGEAGQSPYSKNRPFYNP